MKRTVQNALIGAFLLLISACAIVLFPYQREDFSGIRVKSKDEYLLDIERMDGAAGYCGIGCCSNHYRWETYSLSPV